MVGAVKMTEVNSYTKPYEEGQPMYGDTIAKVDLHTFSHPHPLIIWSSQLCLIPHHAKWELQVIDSRNNDFNKGDYVMGMLNWRLFGTHSS